MLSIQTTTEPKLSIEERARLIKDLACWKAELERSNSDHTDEDLAEFIQGAADASDVELLSRWDGSVGEWVLSRQDIRVPKRLDREQWLDFQLALLLDGQETEYGYLNVVSINYALPEDDPHHGVA